MGIAPTILLLFGILRVVLSFPRRQESIPIFIILFWVFGFFVYQSIQVTPTLRYFIFLYPFFAIFAGIGIEKVMSYVLGVRRKKFTCYMLRVTCFMLLLIWPLMFSSIYFNKNTRVEASEWIYKNFPNSSYILSESWDDSLPLGVENNYGKQFAGEQLPVFDPDTPEKWRKINKSLEKADYYILSSNRGWGSILSVPKKYPIMSKFYNELLTDKNSNYKKIKEFTSYPSLRYLGIPIEFPDQWSDEAFTVYDHQKVIIFQNEKNIKSNN
ncbi:MAG: Tetratricopeptide [Candidatus Roizmanbacteria bacterium GW2011_GWA2_34_18]|uniref:Tetratricopeptide n=1 Tax=Candidatus Roizmanbacteria bacterium GW2011_GWA2_34_18 TaxID=1618477 RepID=A0A0G0DAC5_9BACT|nr:MAG: Tetratricopeptide [Candidatus Roizmanbacteria bacterium GW2011_GWA2_34_18]